MSVNDLLNITDKVEVAFRELLRCGLWGGMPRIECLGDLSVIGDICWRWHRNKR